MKPYPCVISICATVARRAQISQGRLVTDDHHPAPTFTPPELPKKVHVRALPNAAGNFKSTESIQFLFYHLLLSSILYLYLDFFIMTFTANTNPHKYIDKAIYKNYNTNNFQVLQNVQHI